MAGAERERTRLPPALLLATLIGRELRVWGSERPALRYGHAGFAKRGEEYFLVKPDCLRVSGDPSTVFTVFAVFDGHNGVSEAVLSKEHLLEHVMSALPPDIGGRDGWLQALPRALVAGHFLRKGEWGYAVAISEQACRTGCEASRDPCSVNFLYFRAFLVKD